MQQGGTIVFDTRDALTSAPATAADARSRLAARAAAGVDVPELEPVPPDHVVTKTFYLLDGFVGRYASGQTWIEALPPATRARRQPPGARRRQRLADHHHRQRSRRRLGGACDG